jgi:hypothetical protein
VQFFTQVILFTAANGRAEFREQQIPLREGTPQTRLSELFPASALRLRQSPAGFSSQVHVTTDPQWVFILSGKMEIGLPNGGSRIFEAGQHFYSADLLPAGATFDPGVHGHWSRQVGDEPLVTAFVMS